MALCPSLGARASGKSRRMTRVNPDVAAAAGSYGDRMNALPLEAPAVPRPLYASVLCAADRGVKLDFREAYRAGRQAVKLASKGIGEVMVTIERKEGHRSYHQTFGTIPLKEVAVHARPMPDHFISDDGYDITSAFTEYLEPLIGELPDYARLKYKPAKPAGKAASDESDA